MFKAIYILFKGIFELKLLDLSLFAVKLLYGKIVWLIFKYLMPYEKKYMINEKYINHSASWFDKSDINWFFRNSIVGWMQWKDCQLFAFHAFHLLQSL